MITNKEPKLICLDGFSVTGLSVRTANRDEFNPTTAKLPNLWQRFFSEQIADIIPNRIPGSPILGVYSNYESNTEGLYTVTAGVKSENQSNSSEFCTIAVLPGNYLVFENQGVTPHIVVETWKNVWNYFESETKFTRCYKTDFEMYKGMDDIAIYIGVFVQ